MKKSTKSILALSPGLIPWLTDYKMVLFIKNHMAKPAKPHYLLTVVNNQKILQYILSLSLTVLVRAGIKKSDTDTVQ